MTLISKHNVGFKILGPFYAMTQFFGLLLVKETDNKVACSQRGKMNILNINLSPQRNYSR